MKKNFALIGAAGYIAPRHMKAIKIPFDLETGDPKNSNKWWAYEVDSFKKLARIKKEDWINVR